MIAALILIAGFVTVGAQLWLLRRVNRTLAEMRELMRAIRIGMQLLDQYYDEHVARDRARPLS
jgi:hypothetical protein